MSKRINCPSCDGTGKRKPPEGVRAAPVVCFLCGGSGHIPAPARAASKEGNNNER